MPVAAKAFRTLPGTTVTLGDLVEVFLETAESTCEKGEDPVFLAAVALSDFLSRRSDGRHLSALGIPTAAAS